MDDVALITDNEDDMKQLLKITEEIAGKHRIEFGQEKSKLLIINPTRKKITTDTLYIQGKPIHMTDSYKYLGYKINSKHNLRSHLDDLKRKLEGAYQTIISIMGNQNFAGLKMETPWKLIKSCIIPIITYAGENLAPEQTRAERDQPTTR